MLGATAAISGAGFAWGQDDTLWPVLRQGGLFLFMRHADAPGIGDPPDMKIGDCSTQRNLSDTGREQATRIGAEFRRRDIAIGSVHSSRWCRCLDTARLAFGVAEPLELLNSLFGATERSQAQTIALREYLAALPPLGAHRIFVTHATNISALLDVGTADANIHITRRDGGVLQRLGTVAPP
jgi:phosphohistidine phosphatase SixA